MAQEGQEVGFEVALAAMKDGKIVARRKWPQAALALEDGILIFKVSRTRAHSMSVGDILATDWVIL